MPPRLILFDIDGTLVDTAGAGRRAMETAFGEVFQIEAVASRAQGVNFAGMTDWSIIESLAGAVGIQADWHDDRTARLREVYLRELVEEMGRADSRRRALTGVVELLEALGQREGVFVGLLTGNMEPAARAKLEPFDLNRFFEDGGFGCEHRDRREVARIARDKLSARWGLEFTGAQVTVIGDTRHDVDCAKANGFVAIAVASGWGSRESLRSAAPDYLLEDLSPNEELFRALGVSR